MVEAEEEILGAQIGVVHVQHSEGRVRPLLQPAEAHTGRVVTERRLGVIVSIVIALAVLPGPLVRNNGIGIEALEV